MIWYSIGSSNVNWEHKKSKFIAIVQWDVVVYEYVQKWDIWRIYIALFSDLKENDVLISNKTSAENEWMIHAFALVDYHSKTKRWKKAW